MDIKIGTEFIGIISKSTWKVISKVSEEQYECRVIKVGKVKLEKTTEVFSLERIKESQILPSSVSIKTRLCLIE